MFHQKRLTKSVFNLYINSLLPLVIFFVHTTATFAWTTTNKVQSTSAAAAASPPQISTTSTEVSIQAIMSDIPLDTLAAHANSYASANGIQVERRRDDDNSSFFECAPMSLLPNAYPKDAFQQAHDVAPAFNELIDRVSRDPAFLQDTLGGGVSNMDPYTGKLLQLYQQVYVNEDTSSKPAKAADRLGIHRSDYMLHRPTEQDPYQLKQVELNTIAASFAGLSCKIASLHQYLTTRFATETSDWMEANQKIVSPDNNEATTVAVGVPENPALQRIPLAMKTAFDRYAQRFVDTVNKKNLVILFVVQDGETNTVDQRLLEFALWETHGIPVTRRSLTKLHSDLELNQESGAMILRSTGQEVAVVYFRAGYAPTDYPDGDEGIEWHARLLLEQSRAAKCPSLGYHLAGTKKVQQELARPGVLERFYPDDKQKVEAMRLCFAGLYSMGDDATPEDLQAAQNVLDGKEAFYVLKPQREGGGYNFYGKDLAKKLKENTSHKGSDKDASTLQLGENLAEYILMERLFPPQQRAILLRGGKVEGSGDSVSELGCYGCILVDHEGKVLHNEYAGFLLRTKFSNVDEGGVASGFATLSSPYLC
ncbi:glutathione synthetase [Nitzschia inconspicua]|uniref:Glutathione synthetase n=1 Tax=Nitzschia inconspicua TaxID=303405 RepID=A0A9K3LRI1_9STRA|nr:glutathione synthetase [Nitzschia inconspicua]